MSFKHLFTRSLGAAPGRLHFAAHSHHLWPDASFEGQVECWEDAARLADRKWDKVMGEVWPEAQSHVADELGTGDPEAIVFAPNTHELLVRAVAAVRNRSGRVRALTSDGEFHSARRQFARWAEDEWFTLETVPAAPFDSFGDRFLEAARGGDYDLMLVSRVLFGSGRRFDPVDELAALAHPAGPWVVIDGYHAFMALDRPLGSIAGPRAFFLGGGYKYAMSGEGMAFLHAPSGFGDRPPITGWYAEFGELTAPPGGIGYRRDAMRFMGATFDPSALYRFNAVRRILAEHGLSTAVISSKVAGLHRQLIEGLEQTALGDAELLNPLDGEAHARFLAFRTPHAERWASQLLASNCIVDHRGDVLRVGIGLYHDEDDVAAFVRMAAELR